MKSKVGQPEKPSKIVKKSVSKGSEKHAARRGAFWTDFGRVLARFLDAFAASWGGKRRTKIDLKKY